MRYLLIFIFCLPLFLPSVNAQQSGIDHWEMVVEAGNTWHYFPGTEEPPADWKETGFDASSWNQGPGGIGYGDDDDATVIDPVISLYMRQSFTVINPLELVGALLYIDYDDAFVAYLNGVEIARGNIGVPGQIPPYTATADDDIHEAQLYQGGEPESFAMPPAMLDTLLTTGDNLLALQIHNASLTSSDLSSIPWLFVATTDTLNNTPALPSWFDPGDFGFSSHLAIMSINTNGQPIPDDIRITAELKVFDNPDGTLNSLFDIPTGYDGQISIETRGTSSQMFDKKSYAFETQDENGDNNNVDLLGLPEENDWILYGPYSDKSLLRNVLLMKLARELGGYASRTEFCELFINNDFRGLYILMEKIKRDKNRVDINEMDSDDITGDSLTGGYIVKLDWPDDGNNYDWHSPVEYFNGYPLNLNYQYEYPDRDDIALPQELYIQSFVSNFELALAGPNYTSIQEGYRKYIDVHSFVDYFILQEIGNNVDAYRLSNFFTKVRNSKGGKLYEGPVWDFNLAFGNADFGNAWQTWGWALDNPFVTDVIPFHLKRLRQDPVYVDLQRCRWNTLRESTLSDAHIYALIDSLTLHLGPAIDRNFERWDILGQYVWPNYFVGQTYAEEINYLKEFIGDRLEWIDNNLPGNTSNCESEYLHKIVISEICYQQSDTFDTDDWFEIYNNSPSNVNLAGWVIKDENNLNSYTMPVGSILAPGERIVVCRNLSQFISIHPEVNQVAGSFNWKLGKNDRIRLFDTKGLMVCDIPYRDEWPWPELSAEAGQTLELDDPEAELSDPSNWFAGCPGGSPGSTYVFPCPQLSVLEKRADIPLIFPNPTSDRVNIRFDEPIKASLALMSIDGKIVRSANFEDAEVQVDVEDLESGYYILRIISERKTWVSGVEVY